jgi:DNA-directed RNA polymerase subunit RPC12/RpoP
LAARSAAKSRDLLAVFLHNRELHDRVISGPETRTAMPIEFKCQRCRTPLKVPESLAGKKARCPICGGRLRIPVPEPAAGPVFEFPPQPRRRIVWMAVAGGALILVICVLVALSGHRKSRATEGGYGPTLTPEQQARLERPLSQINRLEEMARKYHESRVEERRLRAREVLMKINGYEPVTDFDYALRRHELEEEKSAAKSAGEAGEESDPWKLNRPLDPAEKEKLDRLSDDLQAQSAELERDLSSVGIVIASAKDPLGRSLLDGTEVSAKLATRRESIIREVVGNTE